jgi:hypothetical protein
MIQSVYFNRDQGLNFICTKTKKQFRDNSFFIHKPEHAQSAFASWSRD